MCQTAAMETTPVPSLLPHLWKSTLVSGILSLIVGVLVLVWPGISILAAAVAFGVYLLITGAAQVDALEAAGQEARVPLPRRDRLRLPRNRQRQRGAA